MDAFIVEPKILPFSFSRELGLNKARLNVHWRQQTKGQTGLSTLCKVNKLIDKLYFDYFLNLVYLNKKRTYMFRNQRAPPASRAH